MPKKVRTGDFLPVALAGVEDEGAEEVGGAGHEKPGLSGGDAGAGAEERWRRVNGLPSFADGAETEEARNRQPGEDLLEQVVRQIFKGRLPPSLPENGDRH